MFEFIVYVDVWDDQDSSVLDDPDRTVRVKLKARDSLHAEELAEERVANKDDGCCFVARTPQAV